MPAPKGNQFWKARTKHGRDKLFTSPEILWEAACEYFKWVEDNPLYESKAFAFQGVVTQEPVPKMRAMTLDGLYLFLGIGITTWNDYRNREGYEDYSTVISDVENVIRSQKFAGAAADLLNANIIARDLGLKDATSRELSGTIGVEVYELTETERSARIAALLDRARGRRDESVDTDGRADMDSSGGAAD